MSAVATGVLLGLAKEIGAPILAKILRRKGGKVGALAGEAIETIAGRLGVEPTEKAIVAEYDRRPDEVTTVVREIEEKIGEMARAAADATVSYHRTLDGDRDSASVLNRIWRPLNGIAFGVEVMAIVGAAVLKIVQGDVATLTAIQPLYTFLGTVLGAHAGVVGVYVWRRTDEKMRGQA